MAANKTFDVLTNLGGLSGLNLADQPTEAPKEEPKANKPKATEKKVEEKTEAVKPKETNSGKKEQKEKAEKNTSQSTPAPSPLNVDVLAKPKKKNLKTMHKNFLMSEKRYNQFKELAQSRGQSENALFNDLLTQIFGEE